MLFSPSIQEPFAPEVRRAVVSAYHDRLMSSSDAVRRRARAAYGIVSLH